MKEKDLVSFGNYLLNENNINKKVSHADLYNYKLEKDAVKYLTILDKQNKLKEFLNKVVKHSDVIFIQKCKG